ncbi:MAG TPA: translation initiation factor IF-6 [Candidatus Thorarchaeota archaeon]|nr:MAG: translation initiation factor IF-6 [Candidatus Thorarchaeota archaeon]RLI61577.1 MAG: translation initiation factor IF-6 [Candidatus Thorarchaeota archaeon]HDD67330.1 translation initiation factor IF-6 [Candidatus Thorarchaeota archaeon]
MARTDFEGDSNVGAFAIATDRFVFVSPNMSEKSLAVIKKTFNLPLVMSTVATLDAVGIMSSANSNGIIVPYTTTDEELAQLRKSSEVPVDWIDSKMTALGNIVLANDNGAICHSEFDSAARQKISDVLDVEVVPGTVARLPIVGSNTIATNVGAVVHPLATEEEMEMIAELLKVDVEAGTVNRGSPYTRLGVIANTDAMIVGSETTGVELAHISQVLGLV